MKKTFKFVILAIVLIIAGLRLYNKFEKQQIRIKKEQEQREFLEIYQKEQKQQENAAYLIKEKKRLDSINDIQQREQKNRMQQLKSNIKNLEKEIQNK